MLIVGILTLFLPGRKCLCVSELLCQLRKHMGNAKGVICNSWANLLQSVSLPPHLPFCSLLHSTQTILTKVTKDKCSGHSSDSSANRMYCSIWHHWPFLWFISTLLHGLPQHPLSHFSIFLEGLPLFILQRTGFFSFHKICSLSEFSCPLTGFWTWSCKVVVSTSDCVREHHRWKSLQPWSCLSHAPPSLACWLLPTAFW